MKRIRFSQIIRQAWHNVEDDIELINRIIKLFTSGKMTACQARKKYSVLRETLKIDGNRFIDLVVSAQKYDKEAFRGWTIEPLDKACANFVSFFGF